MIVYAHLLSFAFSAKAFGWASDSRGRANQGPKAICRRCVLFHDHISWCFRTWKLRSTEDDTTPFQLAAWGGHVPLCEWLLSQKAALPRYTTFKSSRKLWEDKAIKDRRRSRKNVSQAVWTQADLHHRNSWSCLAHHFAALAGWTKAANVGIASMKALSKRCLLGFHIFHFSLGCFILLIFSCQIGMGDCCKWLHQQGVDLGATNNQGQARKSHGQMQFCNRRQMCSTCAVSCRGSMWVSLAEDTMLCTRPRTVVMQCCVRGCRSPSGKTWKTWFVFVFYVVYVVYLLVYDLLDPCLACSIFSRRMQIWILIKKTSGIEVSCLESWERKAKRQTDHSCTNSSNHFLRGQTCAALAKKAGFEDEGKAWWTIWPQDVSSYYFCAGSIMPTFFSKSTTAQTEENTKIN